MITATEARAKVEALIEEEAKQNRARAERLCDCYDLEINTAISRMKREAKLEHIAYKLMDNVIAIFVERSFTVETTKRTDTIIIKW